MRGKVPSPGNEPWTRLDEETSAQYRMFECYMLLDPADRTIKKAWAEYCKFKGQDDPTMYSSRFQYLYSIRRWKERALAWDDHLAEQRRAAHEQGLKKEAKKYAIDGEKMRSKLAESFEPIVDAAMKSIDGEDGENVRLAPKDGVAWMRVAKDIAVWLDENAPSEDEDGLESKSQEDYVKELFERAGVEGADAGS